MSVIKYKDPSSGQWLPVPVLKVLTEGGSSFDPSNIPDYVVTEADRVASSISSKIGSNSLTFIAMADMHQTAGDHHTASYNTLIPTGNRCAGQAAKLISDKISPDFFTFLGDFAWGDNTDTTVEQGVSAIVAARNYLYNVESGNETFYTPGNHDSLSYTYSLNGECLSYEMLSGLIGTYRYKDFDSKKVRVICLNTADNSGAITEDERISGAQLQWFAEALDLSAKSDAANWGIIILSHHPLDWGEVKEAANCLAAYLEGAAYSVTHNGVAVSYDFTGKNTAKVIAQFHGHVHGFRVDYINDMRSGSPVSTTVKRIAIPNACFDRNNEYGRNDHVENNGIEFGEETTYRKTANTAKNTAFCVVSVDLDQEIIYADCYGAGYDRIVKYGDGVVVTYSVTNNLSNATNTNGSTIIMEGDSYEATVTANKDYELVSVTVTMGGVDIVSSGLGTVDGGSIKIPAVTGNIVITAQTKYVPVYNVTNQVSLSLDYDTDDVYNNGLGYKDGYRISTSAAKYEGTGSGFTLTGYIPYTVPETGLPQSIYVRGLNWTTDGNTRFYFFKEDKTYIAGVQITGGGSGKNQITTYFDLEELGSDYWKLTPKESGDTSVLNATATDMKSTKYIRFSLKGSGADLIITIDEPIE